MHPPTDCARWRASSRRGRDNWCQAPQRLSSRGTPRDLGRVTLRDPSEYLGMTCRARPTSFIGSGRLLAFAPAGAEQSANVKTSICLVVMSLLLALVVHA